MFSFCIDTRANDAPKDLADFISKNDRTVCSNIAWRRLTGLLHSMIKATFVLDRFLSQRNRLQAKTEKNAREKSWSQLEELYGQSILAKRSAAFGLQETGFNIGERT